jgi:hypothetical protein
MIRGLHGLFYTSQPDELRAFLRDKLGLPFSDVGQGWLIFDVAEADIGVHPVEDPSYSGTHDLSFYCDDIESTVADLRSRGVELDSEIMDQGWGSVVKLTMPGGVRVQIYQPRYQKSTKAVESAKPAARPAARAKKSVAARPAAAKSARRKAPAKKAPAKKAPAKKAPAKKASAKKASAKKSAGKRRR